MSKKATTTISDWLEALQKASPGKTHVLDLKTGKVRVMPRSQTSDRHTRVIKQDTIATMKSLLLYPDLTMTIITEVWKKYKQVNGQNISPSQLAELYLMPIIKIQTKILQAGAPPTILRDALAETKRREKHMVFRDKKASDGKNKAKRYPTTGWVGYVEAIVINKINEGANQTRVNGVMMEYSDIEKTVNNMLVECEELNDRAVWDGDIEARAKAVSKLKYMLSKLSDPLGILCFSHDPIKAQQAIKWAWQIGEPDVMVATKISKAEIIYELPEELL